jgi:hypothetical protein
MKTPNFEETEISPADDYIAQLALDALDGELRQCRACNEAQTRSLDGFCQNCEIEFTNAMVRANGPITDEELDEMLDQIGRNV